MRGAVFANQGAEPRVVDDLPRPTPSTDQILVKSLWTAINPVDSFMANYGLLVTKWPLVIGVDASGIVIEAGELAQSKHNLKPGDYVCGCTRLGIAEYATGQEYFLMDAAVTIPKPSNIDIIQACTLGVGIETAALGIFQGLNISPPDPKNLPEQKDEWIIILGGASSVGKSAIQLAKAAGYKVLASCSTSSKALVESLGAQTFDYKATLEDQISTITAIIPIQKINRIFDATATDKPQIAIDLLEKSQAAHDSKLFATTNDWSGVAGFIGTKARTYEIALGPIGRPDAVELNDTLQRYIPVLVGLVETEQVKTSEYTVVGSGGGIDDLIEAYQYQMSGKAGAKKVVVKIQDE